MQRRELRRQRTTRRINGENNNVIATNSPAMFMLATIGVVLALASMAVESQTQTQSQSQSQAERGGGGPTVTAPTSAVAPMQARAGNTYGRPVDGQGNNEKPARWQQPQFSQQAKAPLQQQQQQHHHHQQQQQQQQQRPDSSSSFLADIEDLRDSSVKTRVGSLPTNSDRAPPQPPDFDKLLEFIVQQTQSQLEPKSPDAKTNHRHRFHLLPHHVPLLSPYTQVTAPGDANNKTTMRFFRNNKTFASIVYTNEPSPNRRLINCHLVDLERHSPDVALFESKYAIRTLDVEFKEMMALIESCTEIARFRPPRPPQTGGGPGAGTPTQQAAASGQSGALRPLLVVGLPKPAPVRPPSSSYRPVVGQELNKPSPQLMDSSYESNRLEPQVYRRLRRRRLAGEAKQLQHELLHHNNHSHPGALLNKELVKIHETNKKLVLGEVTPAPSVVEAQRGGIKEALQEITSYDTTDLLAIWRGILPGTNWCGMGDRATSYNDLGFESDTDICCRAHDFCPIRLSAFTSGYGLFNWSFYTRSHCTCDQNFLDCLQRAQSPLSAVVMKFYFTVMKTTCLHDNETYEAIGGPAGVKQAPGEQQQQLQLQQKQVYRAPPVKLLTFPVQQLAAASKSRQQPAMAVDSGPPIPALRQSQLLHSKLETGANTQQQQLQMQPPSLVVQLGGSGGGSKQ